MSSDTELLRRYVEQGSEAAFAGLVQEHLNLVYSAALRETDGDAAIAEDLCQSVFTELARRGLRLVTHPCLAGWLYTTVRQMAANWRRSERRRVHREQEAETMRELLSETSPNETWKQIRPVLDEAIHELKEGDRAVVVLRFLEGRPLREVGERLGINENAARMRADRALEKLRGLLSRRGITSTAAGVGAAMTLGVITPAPAALAATITSTALASGAIAASKTLTLFKIMSLTKAQAGLIGAVVLVGLAVPTWQQVRLNRIENENAQLRAQAAESRSPATDVAVAANGTQSSTSTGGLDELEQLRQWKAKSEPELLRLRGMTTLARRSSAEAEQLRSQLARQDEAATNATGPMASAMKYAMEQQMDARLSRMTSSLRLTPEQTQAARDILMRQAQAMSEGMQQVFSGNYDKNQLAKLGQNRGNSDEEIKALLTPEQRANYQNYEREEAMHNASLAANSELLQMQSGLNLRADQLDPVYAALYEINFNQLSGRSTPKTTNPGEQMLWALEQKAKALETLLTPGQLESYRQQQAIQSRLMKDIMGKMARAAGSE